MKQLLLKSLAACMLLLLAGKMYSAAESEPNDTQLTSDIATLNGANTGTAGYSYDYDWWEVTLTQNGNLTINTTPSTSENLWCYLYDNDGTTLLASAYSTSSFNVSRNDLAAGTYYIRINCYYAGDSTDYTFTPTFTAPTLAPDNEPNDYYPLANTLGLNDSTTGNVGYYYNLDRDSSDWYQVTTVEDGPLYIYLEPLYSSYTWIYLYDTDGTTLLASGYHNAPFSINRQDLAAGTYNILIKSYYGYGYTPYEIKNTSFPLAIENDDEINNDVANAVTISPNSTIEGHVGYYNNGARDPGDWYEITTSEDGILTFTLTPSLAQYTWMYIYDTDGTTILASNYSNSVFSINRYDLAAGTFYLRVVPYYVNGYNSYSITNTLASPAMANDAEPNNVAATAVTISPNSTIEGHIGYYNNGARDTDDWYTVTTTEDGILNFSLTGLYTQYTWMYIYDTDGITLLASNYANGPFSLGRSDLAAGTYYLRVRMYYGDGVNTYSIENTLTPPAQANDTEPNNTVATAAPLETNVLVDGHSGYYNSGVRDLNDYYALTLSSSGDVTLTVDAINSEYIYCRIYTSDGVTLLGGNYGLGGYTFTEPDLAAGTYIVKINMYYTDEFTPYTLNNSFCPDAITIIAEGETTFCAGESVTLSTPDNHVSYLWNDGSITETNTVTLSGDYSLTIDNGAGCVRTSNTINIESTPLPVAIIDADGPTEFCAGGDVTLSVPIIADEYLWSNGATTPTITVSTTGDYSVELTKNDCSAISDPIHIEVNANPTATISADGPTIFCEGGDVTLTATSAADYLWSNGATTESILVDASGSFSVTITDVNGCEGTSSSTTVTENPNPVAGIIADGPTTFCVGESVNLIASGGTSYIWSNGATSASINVTSSGDYYVTAYSAASCSDVSSTISVTVEACGSVTIVADGPVEFCEGGSVTLTSSEILGNVWNTGETTQSIVVTTSGDYSAVNGVNTSNIISVVVNANPVATINADGPTTFCEGGSVNLIAGGGASYLWSTGETTSSINVAVTDNYSVTAFSAEGCSDISSVVSVTVEVCDILTIVADGPTEFCEGGSVTLTSSEIAGNVWNTGETTQSIVVTTSGDYFTVNGVNTSNTISVVENANPTATIIADGATTFCEGGNVTLNSSAASSYLWSNGATTSSIIVDASGSFSVTITDANGCMATSSSTDVVENANPTPAIVADGPTAFCGGSVGLSVVGTYDSYLWSTGETTSSIIVSTTGDYSVTVTDNDCSGVSNEIAVSALTTPTVTIASEGTLICYEANTVLTATTDGIGIQWQLNGVDIPGATNPSYSASVNGKYRAVATNGVCSTTSDEIKLKYVERVIVSPAGTASLCGPSLTMSVPTTPGATYQWYQNNTLIPGATSNIYSTTTTGKFYALVTKDGCTAASKLLTVNDDCKLGSENIVSLEVYPNPAAETFTVDYTINVEGTISILFTDMAGRVVYKSDKKVTAGNYSDQFDTEEFTSGMYLITLIQQDGQPIIQKLVIEK